MSRLFKCCVSFSSLPDISKWDISSVIYMKEIFYCCKLLVELPNISKWNISSLQFKQNMLSYCYSLSYIPNNLLDNKDPNYECINLIN